MCFCKCVCVFICVVQSFTVTLVGYAVVFTATALRNTASTYCRLVSLSYHINIANANACDCSRMDVLPTILPLLLRF